MKTGFRALLSRKAEQIERIYGYCLVASFPLFLLVLILGLFSGPADISLRPWQNDIGRPLLSGTDQQSTTPPSPHRRVSQNSAEQAVAKTAAPMAKADSLTTPGAQPDLLKVQQKYDGIPNEYVLHFSSLAAYKEFLRLARERGLSILEANEKLLAIRFHADSLAAYGDLFNDIPQADLEQNGIVFTPPTPDPALTPPLTRYAGFGKGVLAWLGLDNRPLAWGKGVTVAIIDTGIEDHPALQGIKIQHIDLRQQQDVPAGSGVYAGHGTAVAALVAGNNEVIQGIAPMADLLDIAVMDGNGNGDTFTLAEGIMTAVEHGARVINMSLGSYADSYVLRQAVSYALDSGVIMVASTGNDGLDQIMYPAGYDGVIAVGAIDALEQRLAFSNYGAGLDIVAPGYEVLSAWSDKGYTMFSGTSAASPFVTGTIAALLSETPGLSAKSAAALILDQSNDTGAPGRDEQFGIGILNLERIQQRDSAGIRDLAVAGYYIPDPSLPAAHEAMPLVVTVQNRGTENIGLATVEININGRIERHTITDVMPGASIGITTSVPRELIDATGQVSLSTRTKVTGAPDQKSSNDFRLEDLIFLPLQQPPSQP